MKHLSKGCLCRNVVYMPRILCWKGISSVICVIVQIFAYNLHYTVCKSQRWPDDQFCNCIRYYTSPQIVIFLCQFFNLKYFLVEDFGCTESQMSPYVNLKAPSDTTIVATQLGGPSEKTQLLNSSHGCSTCTSLGTRPSLVEVWLRDYTCTRMEIISDNGQLASSRLSSSCCTASFHGWQQNWKAVLYTLLTVSNSLYSE